MGYKRLIKATAAAAAMFILILDSRTALEGAQAGIRLCIYTVLPSLFPFCLMSILLTGALKDFSFPLLRKLGKGLKLPENAELLLLPGILGGYPTGAQAVGAAYREGRLSREDAVRMLHFCSNAGPAFLFGMIQTVFPSQKYVWLLWIIHLVSALLVAVTLPSGAPGTFRSCVGGDISVTEALSKSLQIMARICGWVVLFRMVIGFFQRWFLWMLPIEAQVGLLGALELSNGCCALIRIPDVGMRFLLCCAMLSFGGICVIMQTASVIGTLPLKAYITGKLRQTLFSIVMCLLIFYPRWGILGSVGILPFIFRYKIQNNSSNQTFIGV